MQNWRRAAFALSLLVAITATAAACGGGGGGDGNDEDYVKALCESGDILEEVITVAFTAAADGDEDAARDAVVEVMEKWADALDDANQPADAADAHNALVDGLRDGIQRLKDGDSDLDTVFEGIDPSIDMPQAVQDRLEVVANNTAECEDGGFFD